jgi:hypothetical protein
VAKVGTVSVPIEYDLPQLDRIVAALERIADAQERLATEAERKSEAYEKVVQSYVAASMGDPKDRA